MKPLLELISAWGYADIYPMSFFMLGKINEQLGKKVKAIEHYEKFLDLWQSADSGLPEINLAEVEDAIRRLARLKNS